jgi:hypothetical protein
MNKIFTFLFLFSTTYAFTQPTLTYSNVGSQVGDSFEIHILTTNVSPGASGANATWDFSDLPNGTVSSGTLVAASTTPYASTFTNANVAASASGSYSYVKSDAATSSTCGFVAAGGAIILHYDNEEDVLQYPLTYQGTFSDDFHSTFTSGVTFERTGTITVVADGYGTLILPWGTINNVLRVHATEEYADNSDITDLTYTSDLYYWYVPGTHTSVMYTSTLTPSLGAPTYSSQYIDQNSVNVLDSEVQSSFQLYPNPANDFVNVQLQSNNSVIEITDSFGRKIISINPMNSQYQLDVSDWASGVYLVAIRDEHGIQVKQLLVK